MRLITNVRFPTLWYTEWSCAEVHLEPPQGAAGELLVVALSGPSRSAAVATNRVIGSRHHASRRAPRLTVCRTERGHQLEGGRVGFHCGRVGIHRGSSRSGTVSSIRLPARRLKLCPVRRSARTDSVLPEFADYKGGGGWRIANSSISPIMICAKSLHRRGNYA